MITSDQTLHSMPDAGGRIGLFLPWLNKFMLAYAIALADVPDFEAVTRRVNGGLTEVL